MSLVGPRPLLAQYLARYTRNRHGVHEVKPGLTGWAQINGRNAISLEQKNSGSMCGMWTINRSGSI